MLISISCTKSICCWTLQVKTTPLEPIPATPQNRPLLCFHDAVARQLNLVYRLLPPPPPPAQAPPYLFAVMMLISISSFKAVVGFPSEEPNQGTAFCACNMRHITKNCSHTPHQAGSIAPATAWPAGVGHIHGAPLSASFPQALLESALAVWKASVRQTGRVSKLHEEVSCMLWSLGILHTNQHITADGLFCVDIALQDQQVLVL